MSSEFSESVKAWEQVEAEWYEDFKGYVVVKMEMAWIKALHAAMRHKLKTSDAVQIALPWGTYYATKKTKDGENVIDISWEISKGFRKLLDGIAKNDAGKDYDRTYFDEFDADFVKFFVNTLAYGKPDPTEEEKADESLPRGLMLDDSDVVYFMNSYVLALFTLAKDKMRDTKLYQLDLNEEGCKHGRFDFIFGDDDTVTEVRFTPDKVFKQELKDDMIRETSAAGANYAPVTDLK